MAQLTEKKARADADAYCPHCFLLVEHKVGRSWPDIPTRCPHCRLLIGTGRARSEPRRDARRARHRRRRLRPPRAAREGADASPEEVRGAIRAVAEQLGARPERLLMVDYQQRASTDAELPGLSDVFAAFGSWKRARKEAAIPA